MRRALALALTALAAAAALAPVSSASAFCVTPYEELTGDCSPCDEVDAFVDRQLDKVGGGDPAQCLQ